MRRNLFGGRTPCSWNKEKGKDGEWGKGKEKEGEEKGELLTCPQCEILQACANASAGKPATS